MQPTQTESSKRVHDAITTLEDVSGGGSGQKAASDAARVSAAKSLLEIDIIAREGERILTLAPAAVRAALSGGRP